MSAAVRSAAGDRPRIPRAQGQEGSGRAVCCQGQLANPRRHAPISRHQRRDGIQRLACERRPQGALGGLGEKERALRPERVVGAVGAGERTDGRIDEERQRGRGRAVARRLQPGRAHAVHQGIERGRVARCSLPELGGALGGCARQVRAAGAFRQHGHGALVAEAITRRRAGLRREERARRRVVEHAERVERAAGLFEELRPRPRRLPAVGGARCGHGDGGPEGGGLGRAAGALGDLGGAGGDAPVLEGRGGEAAERCIRNAAESARWAVSARSSR